MSSKLLTDEELHKLIMARQASLSREEWQARIDATNEAFDRQEALERSYAGKVSHATPKATAKSPRRVAKIVSS